MIKFSVVKTLLAACLSMTAIAGNAQPSDRPAAAAASPPSGDAELILPTGKFDGDDILLELKSQGKYRLSGGAVEKPEQGNWTLEKTGRHTLLKLTANTGRPGAWLFGVRTKDVLQAVDKSNLKVLDRPLDINADAGILSRRK